MNEFVRRARRDEASAERGFVMVWLAVMFVTLTAFAGLALEFGRWNELGSRIQKAADAAALAGAVYLPEQPASAATTAKNIVAKNGFDSTTTPGLIVTATPTSIGNQLKVTISYPTKNPWGALANYGSTTIVKSAIAEYQLPQNLGSPQNTYGNDPEAGVNPQFWGHVDGPGTPKIYGDAIQGKLCSTDNGNSPDNCPSASQNSDYDSNGYFYGIDVPSTASGALNVQVWDPAFVHTGPLCDNTDTTAYNNLNQAATLTPNFNPTFPVSNPAVRYAPGNGPYCNGDQSYGSANTWTVWRLLAPDSSPWDPTNNPQVAGCAREFPGVNPATNSLKTLLQQTTPVAQTNPPATLVSFFRQWVSICNVESPTTGTYFLQVETSTKIDGSPAPVGDSANNFSIRAGIGGNFALTNGLHVFGDRRMGIYANAVGATTKFYLTRVPPSEAGRTLVLNFFDVGDSPNNEPATLTVLPPTDAKLTDGRTPPTLTPLPSFPGCTFTKPKQNTSGPPWGTFTSTSATCSVNPVSRDGVGSPAVPYNGQWVTFRVPIPTNYTCSNASAVGCWVQIQFQFTNPSASVNDKTTWEAYIQGDPVRLIK